MAPKASQNGPGGQESAPVFGFGKVLGSSWELLGSKILQELIFGPNLTKFDPNLAPRWAILGPRWAHVGGMLGPNGTQDPQQTSQDGPYTGSTTSLRKSRNSLLSFSHHHDDYVQLARAGLLLDFLSPTAQNTVRIQQLQHNSRTL